MPLPDWQGVRGGLTNVRPMMRRFATPLTLLGLACLLLAVPALAAPRATGPIGSALGLTVVLRPGRAPEGKLFPIRVRIAPGAGRYVASAPMDELMTQTLENAAAWIAARRDEDAYPVPAEFPTACDTRVEFPPEARAGTVAGDSAGIALACALYSAASGTPPLADVALTGAIDGEGHVHAVAHLREKLDAVLAAGIGTFVVPAENGWRTESETNEVLRVAGDRVRVVFVETLEEALFFALGDGGPNGSGYARYRERLDAAIALLHEGDLEAARASFADAAVEQPGDNNPGLWRREAESAYAGRLASSGLLALAEGRSATMPFARATRLAGGAAPPALTRLREALSSGARPPATPLTGLTVHEGAELPVARLSLLPRGAHDIRWSDVIGRELVGQGGTPIRLALGRDRTELALALSWPDGSGAVEAETGRWHLTDEGFTESSREDRASVALGPRELVTVAAARALDRAGTDGCDAWVFGAGVLRLAGKALDLGPLTRDHAIDAGTPALYRNEAPSGGPLGSWDGALGGADDPALLRVREASILSGNALRGRALFAERCARCHGAAAVGEAALVPGEIAWEPEGRQESLERLLREDRAHRSRAAAPEHADLIAYLRACAGPPSWLADEAEGSAGDVSLEAAFADGRWMLVLGRAQVTGQPDDAPIDGSVELWLAVAVRDGAGGAVDVTAPVRLTWP